MKIGRYFQLDVHTIANFSFLIITGLFPHYTIGKEVNSKRMAYVFTILQ